MVEKTSRIGARKACGDDIGTSRARRDLGASRTQQDEEDGAEHDDEHEHDDARDSAPRT
jgi:hypothetical protein